MSTLTKTPYVYPRTTRLSLGLRGGDLINPDLASAVRLKPSWKDNTCESILSIFGGALWRRL